MTDPTTDAADPLAAHVLDLDAAENGVWIKIRGDQFLVARQDNPRMPGLRADWLASQGLPPSAAIPSDKIDHWRAYVFARGILLDARFAKLPDVRYTPEHGERIAFDDKLADLYLEIMERCRGDWTADSIRRETIAGNLQLCSPGRTSTEPTPTL